MSSIRPKLIGALVGSLAAVAVAGGGLAFAQESPSTTEAPAAEAPATEAPTTEAPATPDPDGDARPGRDGCPDKDGATEEGATSGDTTSL
jgi:hypothetical protein